MKTTLFSLLISSAALAAPQLAPPSFSLPGRADTKAVFVDFLKADYKITFDTQSKTAHVVSTIDFVSDEVGMPIFDLVDDPKSVLLDGVSAAQVHVPTPDASSSVRVVTTAVMPGQHRLVIEHDLQKFKPEFNADGVNCGFFMDDFDSSGLLERYLPANFEFDTVAMSLDVEIVGDSAGENIVFTNGRKEVLSNNHFKIEFPAYFNSSAVFFHLRAHAATELVEFTVPSVDGRSLPAVVYKKKGSQEVDLEAFKQEVLADIHYFESIMGAFPHQSISVYANEDAGGGMEYSGATVTILWALKHELAHSYFGRGVMPANGNAGWIDEAMATFFGGPYQPNPNHGIAQTNMAAHSPYFRVNDDTGYGHGMDFLGYLGVQFHNANSALSMNGFLAEWAHSYVHVPATTEMLKSAMEHYSSSDLTALFNVNVYGRPTAEFTSFSVKPTHAGPHSRLSAEALYRLQ